MLCRRSWATAWPAPVSQVALVRGPRPRQGLRVQGRGAGARPYLRRPEGAPDPPRAAHVRGSPFPAEGHRSDGPERAPERPASSAPRPPDPGFHVPSCPMAPEAMRSGRWLMLLVPAPGRSPGSACCASAPVVPRVSRPPVPRETGRRLASARGRDGPFARRPRRGGSRRGSPSAATRASAITSHRPRASWSGSSSPTRRHRSCCRACGCRRSRGTAPPLGTEDRFTWNQWAGHSRHRAGQAVSYADSAGGTRNSTSGSDAVRGGFVGARAGAGAWC